jgi:ribosomal protein L23
MPQKVAIMNQEGKLVGRGKNQGWTKKTKKAIVVLPKGERIDVYSGV